MTESLDVELRRDLSDAMVEALRGALDPYDVTAKIVLNEAVADVLRAARATAWDEGYKEAILDYGCDIPWGGFTSDANPYRPAEVTA